MDAGRCKQIFDICQAALAQPAENRSDFIRDACPDPVLRAEVETLARAVDENTSFLEIPLAPATVVGSKSAQPVQLSGSLIDRYRLLQKIGEGGMGEVWLAEQKEPVRRRVALKLVKAGMNTREVLARFESERQALALMDHPAIAKVFDAGSTPQGTPYFIMEYVAGVTITAYCDSHRLSTRERLELFIRVCEGVQHAHQKAIIHRDLKPSNILVTEVDGRAVPKVIDFGVAKALAQKLTADTLLTRVGALVGTPEYMSPEQANSSGEDIDTRTDVYSLGVILYEMLAGGPPLDFRKIAFDEFLRKLREEEPPKPSTKVRTQDPATATEVARKRRTEPLALAKQMRGDLDSIALKALEKERSRRYGSPSDFAADIGRYLRNEAVLAVPPSAAYRARKFARRHRAALVTACAFALVLIVAAAVSIRQTVRAGREAAAAKAISDFFQNNVLAQASVSMQSGKTKPDPDLKVRTALDRAAAGIAGKFNQQPAVEAAIRDTMGQTYMDLHLAAEARKQLERALDLYRRLLGAENPRTLKAMSRLGDTTLMLGKVPEAEALIRRTLEAQRRALGPEDPDTLHSMNSLATAYNQEGKSAQAEALYSQALGISRRILGAEHPETLMSMTGLANAYLAQGKYAQAEALYSQILEISRRILGAEHSGTAGSMYTLARVYFAQGKYTQAETLYRQSLEIWRRVLGAEHPATLASMLGVADVYNKQGKYAEAEALYGQTLEIQHRVLGAENPDTLSSMTRLGDAYEGQGKYAQAEALWRQALEAGRRVLGPESEITLNILSRLVFLYQWQGRYALAETAGTQELAGLERTRGPEDRGTLEAMADLALTYLLERKFAESEPLARRVFDFYRKKQPGELERFRAESLVGGSLAGQKRYAEAEPLLLEGYQGMVARRDSVPGWYHYYWDHARKWIVQLYRAWGKPARAAEWKKK